MALYIVLCVTNRMNCKTDIWDGYCGKPGVCRQEVCTGDQIIIIIIIITIVIIIITS
jgi:hypothetical protein